MVYGLLRALPGDRACLPPSPREWMTGHARSGATRLSQSLTPASGARTTRLRRPRQRRSSRARHRSRQAALHSSARQRCRVHRIPPHVGDVAQRPSCRAGRGELVALICPTPKANIFCERAGQVFVAKTDLPVRRQFVARAYPKSSLRANGSRECAPDDRLREAIHSASARGEMDCFVASLLAMTVFPEGKLALLHRSLALHRAEDTYPLGGASGCTISWNGGSASQRAACAFSAG